MTTVTKTAKVLGLSETTLRIWGEKFADFLSPDANPGKGERRKYTEEDLAVFNTISVLRDRGDNYDEIKKALEDGTRIEATEPAVEDEGPPASTETALQTKAFSDTISSYEARVSRYEEKIDTLQERLLDAEKRATRAEAQLEILKEVTDKTPPQGEKMGFWARLFNRG